MAEPLTCSINVCPRLKVGEPVELPFRLSTPTYTISFPGPLMDVATKKAGVPHPFGESHPREIRCAPVETAIIPA